MTCEHLRTLYQLCQDSRLKLSSSDLIHIVCQQCDKEEVCPSVLVEEYQSRHPTPPEATEEVPVKQSQA